MFQRLWNSGKKNSENKMKENVNMWFWYQIGIYQMRTWSIV